MTNLCSFYTSLCEEDREAAMFVLSVDFGVKHDAVTGSASELIRLQEQASGACDQHAWSHAV